MTHALSFRQHVLKVKKQENLTLKETSERFKIGMASITRWLKNIEPKLTRNNPPTKLNMEALKQDIEQYPDAYCYERGRRLGMSAQGIRHALKRLNVTYKKTLNHPKANPEKRSIFCQKIEIHKKDQRPLIFIDESGFAHESPRMHGYALKGQRCFGSHDWGAKRRTNVI